MSRVSIIGRNEVQTIVRYEGVHKRRFKTAIHDSSMRYAGVCGNGREERGRSDKPVS